MYSSLIKLLVSGLVGLVVLALRPAALAQQATEGIINNTDSLLSAQTTAFPIDSLATVHHELDSLSQLKVDFVNKLHVSTTQCNDSQYVNNILHHHQQRINSKLNSRIDQLPTSEQANLRRLYPDLTLPGDKLVRTELGNIAELGSLTQLPEARSLPGPFDNTFQEVQFGDELDGLPQLDSSQLAQYTQQPDSLLEQRAVSYLEEKGSAEGIDISRLQADKNTL
jgi:hypothetical protein